MKNNRLVGIGILFLALILGTSAYLYVKKSSTEKKVSEEAVMTGTSVPPAHQGHSAEIGQVQSKTEPAKEQNDAAVEEPQTVEIPLEKQQLIGVKTVTVSVQPTHKIIRTVGRIEYDERRIVTVNTKIEGWIEKLYVDYTGRFVSKGDPLVEIYSPELYATQQEFINILKWEKKNKDIKNSSASKMFANDDQAIIEAARQRLKLWDITDEQIKKIEQAGSPIRTLTIYSPANGYVIQKIALQGMRVMPGDKLFDIANLSTVWIIADIFEYEVSLIKTGQAATISLSYFPEKIFQSKVDYVYPTLSGDTKTAKIRFTVPNPGGQLKPQMFTNVEVKIPLGKKLVIPQEAIIETGIRQIVYVDKGDGYFEPREITAGVKTDGFVEVIRGLKAGEKVVSSANFLIDSEAQLKGVTPIEGLKH